MREIARGIYAIDGLRMGRCFLVEGHDGLALIDTSSDGASDDIIAAIESIGRKLEALRTIVATHYHFDHTGNAGTLIERSGAQLCAHEDDVPYVEGQMPWQPALGLIGPLLDKFAPTPFADSSRSVGTTLAGSIYDVDALSRLIRASGAATEYAHPGSPDPR